MNYNSQHLPRVLTLPFGWTQENIKMKPSLMEVSHGNLRHSYLRAQPRIQCLNKCCSGGGLPHLSTPLLPAV